MPALLAISRRSPRPPPPPSVHWHSQAHSLSSLSSLVICPRPSPAAPVGELSGIVSAIFLCVSVATVDAAACAAARVAFVCAVLALTSLKVSAIEALLSLICCSRLSNGSAILFYFYLDTLSAF